MLDRRTHCCEVSCLAVACSVLYHTVTLCSVLPLVVGCVYGGGIPRTSQNMYMYFEEDFTFSTSVIYAHTAACSLH